MAKRRNFSAAFKAKVALEALRLAADFPGDVATATQNSDPLQERAA